TCALPISALDVRIFESLLEPLHNSAALRDELRSLTRQIAQITDGPRRHEARLEQSSLKQLREPLAVGHVGLSTRKIAYVTRVHKPDLNMPFEAVEHGLPENA